MASLKSALGYGCCLYGRVQMQLLLQNTRKQHYVNAVGMCKAWPLETNFVSLPLGSRTSGGWAST